MVAPLRSVVVKRPEDAFQSPETISREWEELGYLRPPDFAGASREHRQLVSILEESGAEVLYLPATDRVGLDSLYAHDPVLITNAGAVVLQTGKPARRGEGPAFARSFEKWGVPILGMVDGSGTAEAGDMIWLDEHTLAVGRGFRTNDAGIEQLGALLGPLGVTLVPVSLPYWNGPGEVLHLMSFISLLDTNLAVVYRRILPDLFFEFLSERGVELVDVPDEEYASLGSNILALSPRNLVMVGGNPFTRERLEAAGCKISEIGGEDICIPGAGGPTCLTRPLWRGF
jgi:arginine deiminase